MTGWRCRIAAELIKKREVRVSVQQASVAIIGCGHVGIACANAILQKHTVRELILVDATEDVARGEALDLQQAVPLGVPVTIRAGTYGDAAASAMVVLTAGSPGKPGGSRLDMLADNAEVVRTCAERLREGGFGGVLLLATNPVDVLTYLAQRESGFPVERVIGTGTLIDSERLQAMLGERLRVDARSVQASVIGEHGDSSVAVWSSARIGGIPLARFPGAEALPSREQMQTEVRRAGPEVAALKGNTCFAIAACVARICEAVLRDERSVLLVSTGMDGQYGLRDVALSTPCVLGKGGVERVLELELDAGEQAALASSATVLQRAYAEMGEAGKS